MSTQKFEACRNFTCEYSNFFLARSLYESAFLPDERRDFDDLLKIAETKSVFYAEFFKQDADLLGIIFYWKFRNFAYVEHFAVAEQFRNQGFGQKIMRNFCEKIGSPVVLEVEKPENEASKRRIRFYENLGFRVSEMPYLQPAYSANKQSVPMLLMHCGEICLEKCVKTIRREVYSIA
ncbi:MAG: GNAT family N-acetyltransferase [Bacteroidales bacterium]|nr:GNAT family N-acetyltransferase [Bacteroidales bacterium]